MAALYIPEKNRDELVKLGKDECVIEEKYYYLRGCIEIPVHGFQEPFIWGTWVELQEHDFMEYTSLKKGFDRTQKGPYYTRLSAHFRAYSENCEHLNLRLYPRNLGTRPLLELEPTEHPMAVEQRNGISTARLAEIYETMVHGESI